MFKITLASLTLASFMTAGIALAADKVTVEPGKGPTEAVTEQVPAMTPPAAPAAGANSAPATADSAANPACSQADLAAMITKAGSMADKDKQRMAMGHLDLAQKSLNQKDATACAMHLKEASVSMGTVTK